MFYDLEQKKNVRLMKGETPPVRSDEEAFSFCESFEVNRKGTRSQRKERLSWESSHQEFISVLNIYESARLEEAPNTYMNDVTNIRYYVFPYFLEKKNEQDIRKWPKHFEEFRSYLQVVPPLKKKIGTETLAYHSKNNIIKSLNVLMALFHRQQKITRIERCRRFPARLLNHRDETSVIEKSHQQVIFNALQKENPLAADFFCLCLHTGLRLNEALGLSLADFYEGPPSLESLRNLMPPSMPVLGFIVLESQPKLKLLRDEDGCVPRKPLKGKKHISSSNSRVIPILDAKAFNIIAKLWNSQRKDYQRTPEKSLSDFLLFEGLNRNNYPNALRKAQSNLGLKKRYTAHDCRHTYCTWLVEVTGGNFAICRIILGHQKLEMTFKYMHMNARIKNHLKTQIQLKKPMSPIYELPLMTRKKTQNVISIR